MTSFWLFNAKTFVYVPRYGPTGRKCSHWLHKIGWTHHQADGEGVDLAKEPPAEDWWRRGGLLLGQFGD